MYKKTDPQIAFEDFNQPLGLTMNPRNRWVQKAALVPWEELEADYASLFPSKEGNVAKPFRMALGSRLIQQQFGFSDEELVEQLTENPYLQYFIGLPGYQEEKPFDASMMVHFRKRIDALKLAEINEKILKAHLPDDDKDDDNSNSGKLILDATCAPQAIKFPTDTEVINTAITHMEKISDRICAEHQLKRPRLYRRTLRKIYLNLVRRKKKSTSFLRTNLRKLLNGLTRDIRKIEEFERLDFLTAVERYELDIARAIESQQRQMFQMKTHSIPERIISFSQPWVRPIVRGKTKAKVEFGAKVDISLDVGFARIERFDFEAFNEAGDLIPAVERFYGRHGHYPEVVQVDKIYRNRANLNYCKEHEIRLTGPSLGRPKQETNRDKKLEYEDNAERVAVERVFSLGKRKFGLEYIRTKLQDTTESTVAMSFVAMNLDKIWRDFVWAILGSGIWVLV